jgi:phosphatidylserine/phosphatidylglycerophosphate/cardiolipin synthase-like enzyme
VRTQRPLLQPGRNVWREANTGSSGVLVDAADYYHAFYWAAREARRSIVMSGWEFDRGVPLLRGDDVPAGAEIRLLNFLDGLCRRNPDLHVCLLAWDFHVVLAIEREWMQRVFFHWMTHEHLHFRLDDSPLSGGSHHQKFVVIDGRIAFLGGIDVCEGRWDDRRHLAENPVRLVRGHEQKPYHDVQAYFGGGEVPLALEQYFFKRWHRAGGTSPTLPPALAGGDDYEPRGAIPLGAARVALSRTHPHPHAPVVREVERLFTDAIAAADALIYIETQYFSSDRIREALVQRMRQANRPRLQIVVVVNERAEAVKEEIAVGLRQAEILEELRTVAAATGHALGCYFTLPDGAPDETRATYVHSKLMAVDDTFLTVGSANLTNRSMSYDSELHASWEARDDGDPRLGRRIRRVRVSLLAEHSGASGVRAVRALTPIRDLVTRLDDMTQRPGARLRPHGPASSVQDALRAVVDPQALPFDPKSAA